MKNKKSSSHIEIILSFVVFIGFVIFLFITFPVYQPKKSEAALDYAEKGILDSVSVRVTYFTLFVNETPQCFPFPKPYPEESIIVKDINSQIIPAESSQTLFYAEGGRNFYAVYSSSAFSEVSFSHETCPSLNEQGIPYEKGLVRAENFVSYPKLLELSSEYDSGYNSLKSRFNLPENENFAFSITDSRGSLVLSSSISKPEKAEIIARSKPIQIVYENSTSIFGNLNIQSW